MLAKLRLLFKDTAIYGTSSILARSLNYLLVPLYANQLSTHDNGVQTIVYANIAIANVIFSYGLETAYLKSASDAERSGRGGGGYFSTAFITLLLTSTLFALLLSLNADGAARAIGLEAPDREFIRYAAVILWIDTLLVIPFAELRLRRLALRFAAARIAGVVAVVVSAMVLLLGCNAGLPGAFLANIIGSGLSFLMLLPVLRRLRPVFSFPELREMLRIGLPYVPTGIAGLLIHLIDRNILIRMPEGDVERLYGAGLDASQITGIYGRVAAFGVLLQLMVQVFRFAWQPFFLQHAEDPDAKRLFRHVMSISTLVVMVAALAGTFFVPDIVRHHFGGRLYLLPPEYWIGLSILPWIFLSYVFDMVSTNLSAGLLITANTRYLPLVTLAGAAVTGIGCWLLIPLAGMDGAAWAIVGGTVVMAFVMGWYSLRAMPVQHDWGRMSLFLAVGIVLGWFQAGLLPDAGLHLKAWMLAAYLLVGLLFFRDEAARLLRRRKA